MKFVFAVKEHIANLMNDGNSGKTLSSELGKALKALAVAMKTMTDPSNSSQLYQNPAKSAINNLNRFEIIESTVKPLIEVEDEKEQKPHIIITDRATENEDHSIYERGYVN